MFRQLSCTGSSFKCFCVSSCASRSVLKKSASVVAEDSALMVTVFTCFSSASVDGFAEYRLGFRGHAPGWLLSWPHRVRRPWIFDTACSVRVFCDRL